MSSAIQLHKDAFEVHDYDSDAFGNLTVPRLLGYLLHAAGGSADSLGFGIRELQKQGLTWVIGRVCIVVDAALSVGDAIVVETWPSGLHRSIAMRDFRILRAGAEVGRATSQWFMLDMQTRMPVRPHDLFPEPLQAQSEHLVKLPRIVPKLDVPEVSLEFDVRKADIDMNRHVTAATYVSWAMENVPDSVWVERRLKSIDIHFLEECHLGSTVLVDRQQSAADTLLHRIRRRSESPNAECAEPTDAQLRDASNGARGELTELARFVTTWVPRNE